MPELAEGNSAGAGYVAEMLHLRGDLHTNQAQRLCSVYAWRRCAGPVGGDADDDLGPELTGPAGEVTTVDIDP